MKIDMSQAATKQDVQGVLTEVRALAEMTAQGFDAVNQRIDKVEGSISDIRINSRRIFTRLEGIERGIAVSQEERIVRGHQIDRAFAWLKQLADKVGVELKA